MLPKFNSKLLEFQKNEKVSAWAFHFMNTEVVRNHVVGVWREKKVEGIQPELTVDCIKEQLFAEHLIFNSEHDFYAQLEGAWMKYISFYHSGHEQHMAIAARAILCCAMHFYIELEVPMELREIFLEKLKGCDIFYKTHGGQQIRIFGRPPKKQLQAMDEHFSILEEAGKLYVIAKRADIVSLDAVVQNEKNWLCVADFLYLGVNVVVKEIVRKKGMVANQNVETLTLHCQPITYLMRMGLGISYLKSRFENGLLIDSHLFLQRYRAIYQEWQQDEKQLQTKLLNSCRRFRQSNMMMHSNI